MKPSVPCSHGSTCSCTKGARTRMPQKPRMTLGIAASISTSGEIDPAHAGGRQQAQVEADRDRDRRAEQQRHEGADGGAEEQRAGAEFVEVRLPGRVDEEAQPELRDRRAGAVHDLVADQRGSPRRRAARRAGRRRRAARRRSGRPLAAARGGERRGVRAGPRGLAVALIGAQRRGDRTRCHPFASIFTGLTQLSCSQDRNNFTHCYIVCTHTCFHEIETNSAVP